MDFTAWRRKPLRSTASRGRNEITYPKAPEGSSGLLTPSEALWRCLVTRGNRKTSLVTQLFDSVLDLRVYRDAREVRAHGFKS